LDIGERIKELRKTLNITQVEFAERMRISKGFVSNLEKGRVQPSDQLRHLMSYEFSVSEYWLVTGKGEMFLPLEENLKKLIDYAGERAFYDALRKLNSNNNMVVMEAVGACRPNYKDSDLDRMINLLSKIWQLGDEDLKTWAKVQFGRAFPPDIEDEVLKKIEEKQGQTYTG